MVLKNIFCEFIQEPEKRNKEHDMWKKYKRNLH